MGVFEEVVINAKSAATTVGKKAERLVDISKLRVNAAELNGEISKKYEALGRLVYDSIKAEANADELVKEYVDGIDVLYNKLDEVNDKINILRNKSACPVCGAQNSEGALFCSQCGVKLKYNERASQQPADCSGAADCSEPTVDSEQ